jgi:hypothetical protein
MSSDCHLNLCVVWWVHYLATAGQSQLKLNSKDCYSRVLYDNYHHHTTVSHRQHELRTHWAHHCCSYRNWRETQSTMSVREESDRTLYKKLCMHCKDNDHFIKNCKLLSAVWSCIINVIAAETVKKTTEEEKNSEKSSF